MGEKGARRESPAAEARVQRLVWEAAGLES